MSRCRSCDAPIAWAKTEAGKPMPLDPAPTALGNVALRWEEGGLVARVLGAEEREIEIASASAQRRPLRLYMSHFATCPHAERHRKGGSL